MLQERCFPAWRRLEEAISAGGASKSRDQKYLVLYLVVMVAPSNVYKSPLLDLYLVRDEMVVVLHVNRQSQTGILGFTLVRIRGGHVKLVTNLNSKPTLMQVPAIGR